MHPGYRPKVGHMEILKMKPKKDAKHKIIFPPDVRSSNIAHLSEKNLLTQMRCFRGGKIT
jgi:hypothetical protein